MQNKFETHVALFFRSLLHRKQTVYVPLVIILELSPDHIPGLSNLRPTGRMRPVKQYYAAREVIYILIVLGELMK